jgi:hypothetical protein
MYKNISCVFILLQTKLKAVSGNFLLFDITLEFEHFRDYYREKVPDFIALISRILGGIIFALVRGWQLTLVFMSVSPFVAIGFNLTVKVDSS